MARFQNRDRLLQKLSALPAAMRKRVSVALDEGADEIVAMQKRLAPRSSGALAASIKKVKGGFKADNPNVRGVGSGAASGDKDLTVTVVAGSAVAYYAAFVEFGTNPHTIKPKSPEGSLVVAGKVLPPGQSVSHPGSAASPFFYPAYRSLKKRVKNRVRRATRAAAKEIAANGGS